MKDNVRKELKELCYFIIENNNALSRPEQLTRVQMLYERLLVLNYLEEVEAEKQSKGSANAGPSKAKPAQEVKTASPSPTPHEASSPRPQEVAEKVEVEPSPEPPIKPEASPKPEAPKKDLASPEKPEANKSKKESVEPEERRDLNDGHQAPKSVNDQLAKGSIQVGLNDRIAFVKHLFNDSQADFNRVLSQLNTLDTYLESMYFIENLVKPDYDWEDKKPYEERLINLIKKRFGEDW